MSGPEGVPAHDPPPDLLELLAERLLGAPPAARAQVLDDLVREHPGFEGPLRRLAEDLAGAERLLEQGFTAPVELARSQPMPAIGPYRVQQVIGEGAFGVVYRCAQDLPVRREVAVKVLRPGAGDRHTLARFEAERHVLARLSHPAIAQVFDAGALPDGRPYFVMEHVAGLPITRYCDRHCLAVDPRLSLFVRLCHGVHHAHVQGIVHRDLKPANILVFLQDGQPRPKIIDFGIAKALHTTGGEAAFRTETGRVVGTPGYMSPEQQSGSTGDVDARADVFALGVILYELLTGELPWGRRPETTDSEPPRPSVRVATDTTGDVARQRAIPPRKLASRLRGDLDWIVLKALAREREFRYASAQELADDVARHLRGEPVRAGPPALRYRLRKLVRRHRVMVGAAAAVVLAVVLGVWLSLHSRAEALDRIADAEAAAASLLARANDRKVVTAPQSEGLRKALVQDALGFYEKFLKDRPAEPKLREGRARALWTLSQVHWLVGEHTLSEAAAREATAESEALVAADPDNLRYRGVLGNALRNLGRALSSGGQSEAARAVFERAVRELELCHARAPHQDTDLLVRALLEWASMQSATELDVCVTALRRAVALQEGTLRERPSHDAKVDLLDALAALGKILTTVGELQEAGQTFRRADEVLATTPEAGPGHVSGVLGASALLAGRRGNHRAAIQRLQKAIEAAERWTVQEPTWSRPWTELIELHGALVGQYQALGDQAAAAEATRATLAVAETRASRFPADPLANGQLAGVLSAIAVDLLTAGRRGVLAEAETCARRAVRIVDSVPTSVDLRMRARGRWLFLANLGCVLDARGSTEADRHWQDVGQALDAWRGQFGVAGEDAPMFLEALLRVARHHLDAGRDDPAREALDRVEQVIEAHSETNSGLPNHAAEAHRLRALLLARRGEDVLAAEASERARTAGAGWRGAVAAAQGMHAAWRTARTATASDPARAALHRDRAIELQRAALAALAGALAGAPEDPWLVVPSGQVSVRLAELLLDRGEREAAWKLLDEALPTLGAMRDEVHANCWDEALYRQGTTLAAR